MGVPDILASLITGALGGLIATSFGTLLVQWFNKPQLRSDPGITKRGESHISESIVGSEFGLEIKNSGRSVATNCKAEIRFRGYEDTTEVRPDLISPGKKTREVNVSKEYIVDLTREWKESGSPTRIDMNRSETAGIYLFDVNSESVGPNVNTNINLGKLKDTDKEDVDGFFTEPIRVETDAPDSNFEPFVNTKHQLSKEKFKRINWRVLEVVITSSESEPLICSLDITWDDSPIPSVNIRDS